MKIHAVQERTSARYVLNEQTGLPRRINTTELTDPNTEVIVHKGQSYFCGPDGTFDVPDEVAAEFVDHIIGGVAWHEGTSPFYGNI